MTATKKLKASKEPKSSNKSATGIQKSGKIKKRSKQIINRVQGEKKHKSTKIEPHNLNASKITRGVSELLRIIEEYNKSKSELFDTEGQSVFLTVAAIRIANTPKRILRFNLPNTLLQETSDVVLIVRDLEPRKKKPDNDAVVQLYESRLQAHNLKHPIKVLPIRQVMTEYNTYEAKKQLSNQFDMFLADAHICGRLVPILGKAFSKKRVNPIPVKIDDGLQMKRTIERALNKTGMKISSDGGTMTVQVGHTKQSPKQISENIMSVAEGLTKEFPGGWRNIRNLILKTARSPGIPLYVSIRKPDDIQLVPTKPKLKHGAGVEGELSTRGDKIVRVQPSGKVIVKEPVDASKTKKKAKKQKKVQLQEEVEEDDEMEEDLSDTLEDDMEVEEPKPQKKTTPYESDSEDPEADEAEEAYLAELSSTTSHLQKKQKKKKAAADSSPKKNSPKKAKKNKKK